MLECTDDNTIQMFKKQMKYIRYSNHYPRQLRVRYLCSLRVIGDQRVAFRRVAKELYCVVIYVN